MAFIKRLAFLLLLTTPAAAQTPAADTAQVVQYVVSRPRHLSDSALLDLVEKQTFRYFWDFAHPVSGLARERSNEAYGYGNDVVTIGGSGFGIMDIIVATERKWITRAAAVERMNKIVRFLWKADSYHGIFPHWMNGATGKTIPFSRKDDGGDLVETSYLFEGLLCAREYFDGDSPQERSIREHISWMWDQAEWNWHTRGGLDLLYWHWSPNNGWAMNFELRGWNEALITYVLAASSPRYAIGRNVYDRCWAVSDHFRNGKQFYGITLPLGFDYGGPLFFAQYSFMGLDPHGLKDRYADYWIQNYNHTLVNYTHCVRNPGHFTGYGPDCWGLSACDTYDGYDAYSPTNDEGTITPTAALSSFPYTPEYSMKALRHFYDDLGDKLWGEYGFVDAFNESRNWYAKSYLAIDEGPIVAMIENYRSGLLWKLFMRCPDVRGGLEKLGFATPAAGTPGAAFVSSLMQRMTLTEKIGQLNLVTSDMDQTGPFVRDNYKQDIRNGNIGGIFNAYTPAFVRQLQDMAVKGTRLHIPLIFGYDVIHGHKTIFPIPLGLSCTWDTVLIRESARIAAEEASADGLNWTFSPMVDICRDPRWGRISEGAGEDPFYGSQVARAMVEGYQGNGLGASNTIMACVKHFALYGAVEAGRDYNTVDMSRLRMYSTYFPPYKAAVEASAGSVMSSFNEVDGIPATGNHWLMTDVLRKQWGFGGFVVTDYNAINEMVAHGMGDTAAVGALALKAGIDMDMMSSNFVERLSTLLKQGKVTLEEINAACRRVLEAKYKLGLFEDPYRYIDEVRAAREIMSPSKLDAARHIARESLVLLKNEGQALPLKTGATIALVGPLADDHRDMIGSWSAAGDFKKSVSVIEGLREAMGPSGRIIYAKGANLVDDSSLLQLLNANGADIQPDPRTPGQMVEEAVSAAKQADVVVAVLGESEGMTGEASSRTELGLPPGQRGLLEALVATGKPVVLVLMNGHPLTLPWEDGHVAAILESWFPGTEAGNAIADVLFGRYNPSGKLTVTFPRNVGQIPIYYNHSNTGRPFSPLQPLTKYASRYIDASNTPLYPFGYGLSYTHFTYSGLQTDKAVYKAGEPIHITVTLTNDGPYDGTEVVQLYIRDMTGAVTRPVEELKGFRKVTLGKGGQQTVSFTLGTDDLKYYDSGLHWISTPGLFRVMAGGNSMDVLETGFTLD